MNLVALSGGIPGDIVTTDRMGALGYNSGTDPNYYFQFNGTSAACPQVSGVAALMLSLRPDLTETQVRTVLQNTARDLGPVGFDNTYGYGLVNAHAAVQAIAPSISGPTTVCSSGATFTINNLPQSVNSIVWTHGTNLAITAGQNTSNCTFSATGTGASWVRARLVADCGEITLPVFNTHAGNPLPNVSGPHDAATHQVIGLPQTGKEYYFSVLNPPAQSSYRWELTPQFPCSGRGCTFSGIGNTIWLSFVHEGNYQLTVEQLSPCNQGAVRYVSVYAVPGHYYLSISPNPVSGETTFNIIAGSNEKLYSEIPLWSFEIHDQSQRLVMSKVNLNSESHTINTSGWEKGIYIVTATFKNEKLSQKLVVQ